MRIVLLDGDRAHVRSLEILLTERGHVVTAFTDARSVCDSLGAGKDGPDALVVAGPALQGAGDQVLKRLRDLLPAGCRIVLLADGWLAADTRSAGLAAHAILPKPLDFDLLSRVLGPGPGDKGPAPG